MTAFRFSRRAPRCAAALLTILAGCHAIDQRNPWGERTRDENRVFRVDGRDDRKIVYRDRGNPNGPLTLLFLHGMGSSKVAWKDVTPALEADYRCITLDLLGHGDSDKPTENISYAMGTQADIVRKFIAELRLNNVVLVGHSYGGGSALLAALPEFVGGAEPASGAPRPPMVRGLVLISATALYFDKPNLLALAQGSSCSVFEALLCKDCATRIVVESSYYNKRRATEEFVAEYARVFADPRAVWVYARISDSDLWPELRARRARETDYRAVRVPVLVLWGQQDRVVPVDVMRRLCDLLPDCRGVLIPDCGHSPPQEQPAAVAH
ncbi:MAG: alpha/beta hydrolase [Phycisphaerae bacterium]